MIAPPPPRQTCARCGRTIPARAPHAILRDHTVACAACVHRYRLHRELADVADNRAAAGVRLGVWP